MKARDLRSLVSLAGGLGLIVALFAAAEFYDASLRAICSINSFFSCALVDESGRTSTLGIPDYLWGIGGFVLILVVVALADRAPKELRWPNLLVLLTTAGVALSLYFLYVELALIHALCLVCATDYLFGALAWGGSIALALKLRRREAGDAAAPPTTGGPGSAAG